MRSLASSTVCPQWQKWNPPQLNFTALLGVYVIICMQSIRYLYNGHSSIRRKQFYICYSFTMALMFTIRHASNTLYGQYVWIEKRDTSGGPGAYFSAHTTWWFNTVGTSAVYVTTLMSDGLLVSNFLIFFFASLKAYVWFYLLPIISCIEAM